MNIDMVLPKRSSVYLREIYPDHVQLRKRIKKKFAAKIKKIKSRKRRHELIASFWGMTKHADCANLNNKLIGEKTMRSFKDLKVTYKPANGQKYFPGDTISIRDLVNLQIIVHDFQLGVKTREGEDRCVVSIEMGGHPGGSTALTQYIKTNLQYPKECRDCRWRICILSMEKKRCIEKS